MCVCREHDVDVCVWGAREYTTGLPWQILSPSQDHDALLLELALPRFLPLAVVDMS